MGNIIPMRWYWRTEFTYRRDAKLGISNKTAVLNHGGQRAKAIDWAMLDVLKLTVA